MRTIKLLTTTGNLLYQGHHHSLNEAIEYAINNNINLDNIDLSGALIPHINLDGIVLYEADFSGADLTGANMSEANFIDCNFNGADLTQACCCYSNFFECHFRESIFANTDISMACLQSCAFEGASAFNLNFHSTFKLGRLKYHHPHQLYLFDEPPTIIKSRDNQMVIISNDLISKQIHKFSPAQSIRTS